MKKFTAMAKLPMDCHAAAPQAKTWQNATLETNPEYFSEMKIVVLEDGTIYTQHPRHSGSITQKKRNGWERVRQLPVYKDGKRVSQTPEDFIQRMGAKPANFRGGPRK